jgi:hypothetical protein
VIYRNYRNGIERGLWEKYTSGIKVTMLNSQKSSISISILFKTQKFGKSTICLPKTDKSGEYYQVYINGKLLGERDIDKWTDNYNDELMNYFKYPVVKPLLPYFEAVDISVPF